MTCALFYLISGCSDPEEVPTTGVDVSVHPTDWLDPPSDEFHGTVLESRQFDTSECRQCHGEDYNGGLVEVSCRTCHSSFPHTTGWVGSHPGFIKDSGYDLAACQGCHGANYSITKVDNSCLTCHVMPGGPEACNTCHGNFGGDATDFVNVAPPEGLNGETDPMTRAVGAHQAHLTHFTSQAASVTCLECHVVPSNFDDPGHIEGGAGAEIVFGGNLGSLPTEGGLRVPAASYDGSTPSCANTYCHGNWGLLKTQSGEQWNYIGDKIEGNSASPTWTDPTTAACGTCHNLPPTGHDV